MNKYMLRLILFLFIAILLPLCSAYAEKLTMEEKRLMDAYLNGDIIRLHIIANSNSPADQAIKLAVRDAVIDQFTATNPAMTCDEVYLYWKNKLDLLQNAAVEVASGLGYHGKIQTSEGVFDLPEKQYGNVTLPAGEYKAIRIILGNGNGQNWWCILYPQLCLTLADAPVPQSDEAPSLTTRILRHWLAVSF